MLELPFQAKMTDRLAAILRRIVARHLHENEDMLPSIMREHFGSGPRAGTGNWMLSAFSRKFMRPEDIVTVADFSFHIPVDQRQRLAGHVLDWSESEGLTAYENAP